MALVLANRVRETTTTTGTGTVTLAGAVTGYQSFSVIGNANTTYYCIAGQGTSEFEVGLGTYTLSGTTLARTTILASSNAGSAVSFSAGTKDVFVTYPSNKSVNLDATGNLLLPSGTVSVPGAYFSTETSTGFYRIGANNTGFAISGTKLLDFSSALFAVTGAATVSTTLGVTGATTLSSTLGVSGIITSTVTSGNILNSASATTADSNINLQNTAGRFLFGVDSSTGGSLLTGSSANSAVLNMVSAKSMHFGTSNAIRMTIDSAGAVTIPGTLGVTGNISGSGTASWLSRSGATTAAVYQRTQNTSGDLIMGVESSTGSAILTGAAAYSSFVMSNAGTFNIGANGSLAAVFTNANTALQGTLGVTGVTTFGTTVDFKNDVMQKSNGTNLFYSAATANTFYSGTTSINFNNQADNLLLFRVTNVGALSLLTNKFTVDVSGNGAFAGTLSAANSITQTGADIRVLRDGSDTAASGAMYLLGNAASTRFWADQLSASNNKDWWYFDGATWVKKMTLSTAGTLTVTPANTATYSAGTAATPKLISTSTSSGLGTYGGIQMGNGGSAGANILVVENAATYGDMVFQNYDGTYRETMRIFSGNAVAVTRSRDSASEAFTITNSSPTATNQYAQSNTLSGDPNDSTRWFLNCYGNATTRATIRSNGGLANFSANNVNLSDKREKTNFAPAKSYLDVICAIPVQTFNYIDQNMEDDSGLTLGVVAQDVEAVAPEMVMESNWGTMDDPKMRLSIYQTDLQYALMKAIQELSAKVAALEAR